MLRALATPTAILLAASGALLAGCGAGTRVVTSTKPPAPLTSAATSSAADSGGAVTSAASASGQAGADSGGTPAGTPAQVETRTQSAPAYVHEESAAGELGKAVATVKAQGYTPYSTSEYHPNQTLRVLVGTRSGSGDGYDQHAFFFVGGRYLGTDTSAPSAAVHVISQGDTEVTLAYAIYRAGNPLCCPAGGEAHVTFQLNNGTLAPVQAIPPTSERR
jgi:hypothetical protein